ncbi:MAG: Adenylate and Guanylate cyclase catalytic domain protein [Candidatus Angelobacter sp.]|nr:Adenylate and Guanylate cyclase catalytic domain protein [Candidatus Angelobacter sp.]
MDKKKTTVSQLLGSVGNQAAAAAELEKFRRNITILFTDIKGSTSYFERYGDAAGLLMVSTCNNAIGDIVREHGGKVIKEIGDAVMASYDDCTLSVKSAIKMQQAIYEDSLTKPEQDRVAIRIGLNYGPGIVREHDVFGDVVNVASRVESVGSPEQIVISDTLYEQVASSGQFKLHALGRFALKGKGENRELYEVQWTDRLQPRRAAAHTVVMSSSKAMAVPRFKLLRVLKDGSVGDQYKLKNDQLEVGRLRGDVQFPEDDKMAPLHARFSVEKDQLFIEDISGVSSVFIGLIATYTMRDGDIIRMGEQMFRFREKVEAVANAAARGTTIIDLSATMDEPVAELIFVGADFLDTPARLPLNEEEISFGRSRGTFVFPEDPFMSRAHCKIYHRGEDFFVEDLGSRNGTFIKVRGKAPVPTGATVLVGSQVFKLDVQ